MNVPPRLMKKRTVAPLFGLIFVLAAIFVTVNLMMQILLDIEKAEEAFGVEI